MRKPLRTALIWMLMLALPAQAMAALGMQLCEQVHRGSALHAERHDSHDMRHEMMAGSSHDSHQAACPACDDDSPTTGSLCSLCAFCVGVAASGQPLLDHSIMQDLEPATAWPDRLLIGVVDTPERPPRQL